MEPAVDKRLQVERLEGLSHLNSLKLKHEIKDMELQNVVFALLDLDLAFFSLGRNCVFCAIVCWKYVICLLFLQRS